MSFSLSTRDDRRFPLHNTVNIRLNIVLTMADSMMDGSLLWVSLKCSTKFDAFLDLELVLNLSEVCLKRKKKNLQSAAQL